MKRTAVLLGLGWISIISAKGQNLTAPTEKGNFYATLNFSIDQRTAENEDQLLRYVEDQDRFQYRFVAGGGYFIAPRFALGLNVGYGQEKEELIAIDQNDLEVTSKTLSRGISLSPHIRNYVPLGNGSIQILVQTELGFAYGETLKRVESSGDMDRTEGWFFETGIGVSPGAVLFFDEHWAFETLIGLVGINTRIEESVTNGNETERTRVVETGGDFKINLLSLQLGVAYYF